MPLIKSKSKAARATNIKTLMGEVGKSPHVQSPAQAVAIGYATQRRAGGKDADPEERRYRAQDGLRTLQRAEDVHGDPALMKDMLKHAKDQHDVAKRANAMVKSAAISERQADRMKGKASAEKY
jgi:hypothetical protein